MFEMGRRFSIGGHDCPVVFQNMHCGGSHVHHGLDGKHHSGLQFRAAAPLAVIRNLGLLVELAPYTVADEFTHDGVAVADDLFLDRSGFYYFCRKVIRPLVKS